MKQQIANRLVLTVIFLVTHLQSAHCEEVSLLNDIKAPQQASEYIFRSSQQESLISVQLLGAVSKPGVYYIPIDTDLLKLLTLAGGSAPNGDVSEVLVRKQEPHEWQRISSNAISEYKGAYEVNAEKIIKFGGASQLKLAQNDFVYVPQKSVWVTNDTSRAVTTLSVVMGIVLSGFLIHKNFEQK